MRGNYRRDTIRRNPLFDVEAWRLRMGLNQDEAAELLGYSEQTIRRWERYGFCPPARVIKQMQKLEYEAKVGIPTAEYERRVNENVKPYPKPVDLKPQKPEHIGIAPSSW